MTSAQRNMVIVVGVVICVTLGCARSTADGVRRIELVAGDTSAPTSSVGLAAEVSGEGSGSSEDSVAGEESVANSSEAASSPSVRAANASRGGSAADEQFAATLDRALESGDLCVVWDLLMSVRLSAENDDVLAEAMRLVVRVMGLSSRIVPSALAEDWDLVTDRIEEMAESVSSGDKDAASLAYHDTGFVHAQEEIAQWTSVKCG
ncbi:MAG: hypothetical protein M9952_10865 [Microthrixaceae bacterium]|nr:hypothetical protein [Microthrixaceae bacterium]MCO5313418.1 hypothetical protein [Microthrixaceae bacterium]HPB46284.1 hypothetical protein [Microthrixaceae bacterium]